MRDAKRAIGFGARATYAARLMRNFQIGASLGYGLFRDSDAQGSIYVHEIQIPLELGLVIPTSDKIELLVAARVGFTHLFFPDQTMVDSAMPFGTRGTLRSMGITAGPVLAVFFAATDALDVFAELSFDLRFTHATNGVSYLSNVAILGGSVPLSVGVRTRF